MSALGQALSPLYDYTGRFEDAVLDASQQRQSDDEAQMQSDCLRLKPLEQAVLWRMLEQGPRYRPYDGEAFRFYQEKTGKKVSPQQAQNALESLRQRTPTLIWKSARGEYALDDAAMHRWYTERVARPVIGHQLKTDISIGPGFPRFLQHVNILDSSCMH